MCSLLAPVTTILFNLQQQEIHSTKLESGSLHLNIDKSQGLYKDNEYIFQGTIQQN